MYDDRDVQFENCLIHSNYLSENKNPVFRMKDCFHNQINDDDDDDHYQDVFVFDRNTLNHWEMDLDNYQLLLLHKMQNLPEDFESNNVRQDYKMNNHQWLFDENRILSVMIYVV